ncbi:MAG TPA: hypothetical protein PKE04_05550 [Clostridia bacterium]|nr:hypothetical protein [Clostridia bacterium]
MAVQLGIQLYSLRNEMAKDPIATLKKTMDVGYRHLEPANGKADRDPVIGYGISGDALLEAMAPYGGSICASHLGPLSMETLPKIAAQHRALGNRNIVEAIMFFEGYDHLMRRCEEYNRMGKYLVENGLNPLLYHNHYHEYQLLNGKEILYHIMENTSPDFLRFELDTGWVMRAGRDPVREMAFFGTRVRCIHIKDFSRIPPNLLVGKEDIISWQTFGANNQPGDVMRPEDFVEIGTGVMEIQAIIDKADELGVEYAILEQDVTPRDIFESIRISLEHLRQCKGLAV